MRTVAIDEYGVDKVIGLYILVYMVATQKIQDWGNSKGVRIPKKFITGKYWQGVTQVTMSLSGNRIILTPDKTPEAEAPGLDELLDQVMPENLHQAVDFGPPTGRELI